MSNFKKGLFSGIPIGLGYLAVSFSFGILAAIDGFSCLEAVLLSALNVTSAGQFAGLNIIMAGGGLFEMAFSQFVINIRYSLMSLVLSQKADDSVKGIWRIIFAFFHTDEIFAVAASEKKFSKSFFLGLTIIPYAGWVGGTALGALFGAILPEVVSNALGIALYGMFIAIVVPTTKKSSRILIIVLIAIGLSCCFYYLPFLSKVSEGFSVIICAVVAAVVGAVLFPVDEGEV